MEIRRRRQKGDLPLRRGRHLWPPRLLRRQKTVVAKRTETRRIEQWNGREGSRQPVSPTGLADGCASVLTPRGNAFRPSGRQHLTLEALWQMHHPTKTARFFEITSKRRKGFPSETQVKRGVRVVHGDKELREKLGRKDPCPCGSGRSFQELLSRLRSLRRPPAELLLPRLSRRAIPTLFCSRSSGPLGRGAQSAFRKSSMSGFDLDGLGVNPSEAASIQGPLAQNQSGSPTN